MVYPALLPLMRTPRLPAVHWTSTGVFREVGTEGQCLVTPFKLSDITRRHCHHILVTVTNAEVILHISSWKQKRRKEKSSQLHSSCPSNYSLESSFRQKTPSNSAATLHHPEVSDNKKQQTSATHKSVSSIWVKRNLWCPNSVAHNYIIYLNVHLFLLDGEEHGNMALKRPCISKTLNNSRQLWSQKKMWLFKDTQYENSVVLY